MSRIGKVPIAIPKGVDVTLTPSGVKVKGPKGQLSIEHRGRVTVTREGDTLHVARHDDERQSRAYHGLYQRMIRGMVIGVTQQYKKDLEIQGGGWRAAMENKRLVLNVGHSHPIYFDAPPGITITCPKQTQITVEGVDKQVVGQVAADIRNFRPPEPYNGKGIRYVGEYVRQKEGKKAGAK